MSRRFDGRVCLVTGATGMGGAVARALAAKGGSVFVVARTADHLRELAESIGSAGGRCAWSAADLTDEAQVASFMAALLETYGRLDRVFGAAGVSARRFGDGPLHAMTLAGWEAALAANARSTFLVCRAAVRQMLGQEPDAGGQRGAIVTMSSVIARRPSAPLFETHGYAASKGAVEAFSLGIAAYYAPQGIRVNVLAPALVETPMSARARSDEPTMAFVRDKQPLAGGIMAPEDVVGTVLFLLSDEARMVTGQVLTVDAGWSVSEASPRG
jgi:NAD(P)-dependent dehydrogenase (short-subunit alcohol dehydrogenase family)